MSEEEVFEILAKVHSDFDADNDGEVTGEEFKAFLVPLILD